MRIAYRRLSGPIGTSALERGTRGMWWEKRRALVCYLRQRGHSVEYVGRMTRFSQSAHQASYDPQRHGVLLVEFGSSNAKFYGDDLRATAAMLREHRGQVVFLCDDPDLPFPWRTMPYPPGRTRAFYNAVGAQPFGAQPTGVPTYDFPFSALIACQPAVAAVDEQHWSYIGRPGGRAAAISALVRAGTPLRCYAQAKEFADWPQLQVAPPPAQPQRRAFYATRLACLALADAKHKKLRWRTGRAYHAVVAGCPVAAEADHPALGWALRYQTPAQLEAHRQALLQPSARAQVVQAQQAALKGERALADAAAQAVGL